MAESALRRVVLDACVLAPPVLCDLVLRLAETPPLFVPHWSSDILAEVKRAQMTHFRFDDRLSDYWRQQVTLHFPDAEVIDYADLVNRCANDPKDRHVLAAAIASECAEIVTSNLKDFQAFALEPWRVVAIHPSDFLLSLQSRSPEVVADKLDEMAAHRRLTRTELLTKLEKVVPAFVQVIS